MLAHDCLNYISRNLFPFAFQSNVISYTLSKNIGFRGLRLLMFFVLWVIALVFEVHFLKGFPINESNKVSLFVYIFYNLIASVELNGL